MIEEDDLATAVIDLIVVNEGKVRASGVSIPLEISLRTPAGRIVDSAKKYEIIEPFVEWEHAGPIHKRYFVHMSAPQWEKYNDMRLLIRLEGINQL